MGEATSTTIQLDDPARAKSGIGVVGASGTEIRRPPPKPKWIPVAETRLRVGGTAYRREYSGGEFDDSNYGIYAVPRFISNRGKLSVLFQADRRAVNSRPYSRREAASKVPVRAYGAWTAPSGGPVSAGPCRPSCTKRSCPR